MTFSAKAFSNDLLVWHQDIDRSLPWKEDRNPYKIWLSEIILQQTRVKQGLSYYLAFSKAYPSVDDLASAPLDDILALWKGLGYYARARNMHRAAQMIMSRYNGIFPNTYDRILSLPGVGPYTAAAIASFAYGLPHAVVDGNVYRVLSRYFGVESAIDSTKGKLHIARLAQEMLPPKMAAEYNQAIMDFGALVCTPRQAKCTSGCPVMNTCSAYLTGMVDILPIKQKKIKVKHRYFHYFICLSGDSILMQQRTRKDIWQGLYQLPIIESNMPLSPLELYDKLTQDHPNIKIDPLEQIDCSEQKLTHQHINAQFYMYTGEIIFDGVWMRLEEVTSLGLPKVIDDFFISWGTGHGRAEQVYLKTIENPNL